MVLLLYYKEPKLQFLHFHFLIMCCNINITAISWKLTSFLLSGTKNRSQIHEKCKLFDCFSTKVYMHKSWAFFQTGHALLEHSYKFRKLRNIFWTVNKYCKNANRSKSRVFSSVVDPELLPGSGFEIIVPDPDPAKY